MEVTLFHFLPLLRQFMAPKLQNTNVHKLCPSALWCRTGRVLWVIRASLWKTAACYSLKQDYDSSGSEL